MSAIKTTNKDAFNFVLRDAQESDVARLVELELECFDTDQLSSRSFKRFISEKRSDLYLLENQSDIVGYLLLLYRRGTSLARLYSLAVSPKYRKQGMAKQLMQLAEQLAVDRHCVILRLEVRQDNNDAIKLYQSLGYKEFAIKHDFYEDHTDAICMQKQIIQFDSVSNEKRVPYIPQSTPFTCGPASLLMVFNYFQKNAFDPYSVEIEIWREATTIFMTSGHGGCGPRGLALAAHRRGFKAEIYLNDDGFLFTESVRNQDKKAIIERVNETFKLQVEKQNIAVHFQELNLNTIKHLLEKGWLLVVLISTWQFDKSKSPHWVVVCAVDDYFVYINDPDVIDIPWLSASERQYIPISHSVFNKAFRYGKRKLKAAIAIKSA